MLVKVKCPEIWREISPVKNENENESTNISAFFLSSFSYEEMWTDRQEMGM